ncbi:MAG: hypothetical protein ACFHWX_23180 [Bacteroidota bacterium]
MYTSEIQRNGKKIIYTRFSHLSEEQMIAAIKEQFEVVKASPGKVVTLADFTNTAVSNDFMTVVKKLGKEMAHKIDKQAVLGITGLKKVLLSGYNAFTSNPAHPFSTEEEAINFLTKA